MFEVTDHDVGRFCCLSATFPDRKEFGASRYRKLSVLDLDSEHLDRIDQEDLNFKLLSHKVAQVPVDRLHLASKASDLLDYIRDELGGDGCSTAATSST